MEPHQSRADVPIDFSVRGKADIVRPSARVLRCMVVTPERTVEDEMVEFVAAPLFDGEIGIAPGHTPLIGRLGHGELRLVRGGETTRYYVGGGFLEVAGGTVCVLTGDAVAAERLDPEVAAERLSEALAQPAHSPERMAARDRAQLQARAQLRVARHAR